MTPFDVFKTAPPGRQIWLVVASVALIAALMAGAYAFLLRKPYAVLFTNLKTADAATIVAELDKKKVPYRLKDGGATILVPQNLKDSTRLNVTSGDLPLKGTVGFELFNKSDMGLTEFAQKINYQRALQGELERTIMNIDGIDAARVHLTLADPTVFRDDRRPSKASVSVTARAGWTLSSKTIEGIQRLVAAAAPELAVADVVVLDAAGDVVSSPPPAADAGSPERLALEQYYADKVRVAVASVYAGQAMVKVVADMLEPLPPAEEEEDAGLAPACRYPLSVEIAFPQPPSAELQQKVKAAVEQAAGLQPSAGDVLILSSGPPAPAAAPMPLPGPVRSSAMPARSIAALSPTGFWEVHLLPVLAVLLICALLLLRRRGVRSLNPRQRAEYAKRLRKLLEGDVRATSRP